MRWVGMTGLADSVSMWWSAMNQRGMCGPMWPRCPPGGVGLEWVHSTDSYTLFVFQLEFYTKLTLLILTSFSKKLSKFILLFIRLASPWCIIENLFFLTKVANIGATFRAPIQNFDSMCFDIRRVIN